MVYTFGAAALTDTSAISGPEVRSALDAALLMDLNVPAGAAGSVVVVTTAGGSARLTLADRVSSLVAAEPQGVGAVDGVGGTLGTALDLTLGPNALLSVTGRLNTAPDVDVYRLVGAEAGALITLSAAGAQGGNAEFRLFSETGAVLAGPVGSVTRFVLPRAATYFLGYSSFANITYNPVDGTGTVNGASPGDYTLTLRYAGPGVTSLDALPAVAASGVPATATLASANVGQAITVQGNDLDASTRVRFTTFSGNSPQNGLGEREQVPTSVGGGGTSLTVAVANDAVTGLVRLPDEPAGLVLQIVPTLTDVDLTSSVYDDGANLSLTGSGFVEGAQDLLLGTGPGTALVSDLWNSAGPDTFATPSPTNGGANIGLPVAPPFGPFVVRTLGGSSTPFSVGFSGFAPGTVAERGTPADPGLASANARQAITLQGSGFDLATDVVFVIQTSTFGDEDVRGTRVVNPTAVAPDGTSLTLLVPDDAATGEVHVVGAPGGIVIQIVPTIV
ncbi:MAG: hypothetical protein ACREQL_04995, partial [Candidatus Binatia bacterium]